MTHLPHNPPPNQTIYIVTDVITISIISIIAFYYIIYLEHHSSRHGSFVNTNIQP